MKKATRVIPFILILLVLMFFLVSLSALRNDRRAEGREQLEEVLRRTAVTCYAAEGFYPPNLDYMRQHYGLLYDGEEYAVYYELFASNIMPIITVLEK